MKVKSSKVFVLFFIILVLLAGFSISFANERSFGTRSVRSELSVSRTSDGSEEMVVVTGSGFVPTESVSLVAQKLGHNYLSIVTISEWTVIVNAKGGLIARFPASYFNGDEHRFTITATAQTSGKVTAVEFKGFALAPSADLDQCANGPFSAPVQCTGANWQNGNVGQNSGHYYEGDSIPYRMKFDDLAIGVGNTHTVTIEWDTTQSGKHALDFITTYNRTENAGNNPCSGIVPACGTSSTFPIPLDPNVSGAGVTQVGGQVFTMWGGTITGASAYTLSGTYAGNSSTAITVSFIADQANPVLAWSGHIAKRQDWSLQGGSASDIPGSPYHTRLIDLDGAGGNQDRSLSAAGVRLTSEITIIKQASPESSQAFGFSATGDGLSSFTLWDDGVDNDATPNSITFSRLLEPNSAGDFSITENMGSGYYLLSALSCIQSAGGTSGFSTSVPSRTAEIKLEYGDTVTCTFNNVVTTAASLSVSGRVAENSGRGLSRVLVTILDTTTGETRTTYTSTFGRFGFEDLRAGDFYVVSVRSKRHEFSRDSQGFVLNDVIDDLEFLAMP